MQILRHDSHIRRTVFRDGGILAAMLVVLALLVTTLRNLPPLVWTIAVLGCLLAMTSLWPTVRRSLRGDAGERAVLQALRSLPNTYTAVTNFIVPGTRSGDIDLLVVGPMGIVMAEIKAWSGTILYAEGRWARVLPDGRKYPAPNVSAQARTNLGAVKGFLARRRAKDPVLSEVFVPVQAALVFVGTEQLNVVNSDILAMPMEDFLSYVEGLPLRLKPAQVAAAAALFRAGSERSDS